MEKKTEEEASDPLLPRAPPLYYASPASGPLRQEFNPTTYVHLPAFLPERRIRHWSCCSCSSPVLSSSFFTAAAVFALLGVALFLLWPSHPDIRLARLSIERVHVSLHPSVTVSIYLRLRIRIRNPDFFSLDYDSVDVAIGYRGERLGSIRSAGEHVRARGVSYVDAELQLDGIEVLHDVFHLIEDFTKRSIPFDTVTEIRGELHFVFFDIPVEERLYCSLDVNPTNHTDIKKDCYIQ